MVPDGFPDSHYTSNADPFTAVLHVKREGSTERNMLQFCVFSREREKRKTKQLCQQTIVEKLFQQKMLPLSLGVRFYWKCGILGTQRVSG